MLVFIAAAAIFAIAWVRAEYRAQTTTRVTLGLACMGLLTCALFFETRQNALFDAHQDACFRLLGKVLDEGDLPKAREAVAAYNRREANYYPAGKMLDVLTED